MKKILLLLLIILPQYIFAQRIVSTGNEVIFVRPNAPVSPVGGFELKGSSQNMLSLPQVFSINNTPPFSKRVLMGNPNVVYQVRDVGNGARADFFTDILYTGVRTKAEFALTNKSAMGDFNLRLREMNRTGYNDIPLEWRLSKSNSKAGDSQDLIFSWGEEVELVTIPFKRLFVFDPATEEWEQLPEANTTVDETAKSLVFSEYEGALSNTRFMLAQAIPLINLIEEDFRDILWCPEIASPSQTFKVEAFDLTSDLKVTAPANFEIALSEDGPYSDELVFEPSNGKVPLTTLHVRIKATATAAGTFSIIASSFDTNYTVDSPSISITSIPDITPPVLSLQNLTLFLDDNGRASFTVEDIDTGSTDDCNVNLYAFPNVFSCGDVGVNNVLVFGIDKSGNITFSDITVTVLDNIFPTITAPEDLVMDAGANCTASGFSLGNPIADDNCTGFVVTNDAPSVFPIGTTTVTWTVTDASGNAATDTQEVTVVDTTAPTISGPGLITVNATDNCTIANVAVDFQLTTGDNCAVTLLENDGPTAFELGFTTIVWTIADAAGNTTNFTQMIQVVDNTGPEFGALPVIEISADTSCEVTGYSLPDPPVTDNCSVTSISNDAPSSLPIGTTVVTWTAVDVNGNQTTASQNVVVVDQTAPVVDCPSMEASYDSTEGVCGLLVTGTIFDAQATDNCSVISLSHNYDGALSLTTLAGATFPVGTTPVTWTATDAAGNTSTCTINVVVEDKEAPVFTNFPPSTLTVGIYSCGPISNWNIPTVADNCGIQSLDQTAGPAPDAVLTVGIYTITYKATDIHGNETEQSFELQVDDSNLPRLVCPEDLTAQATDPGSCTWTADETLTPKQATGNCIDLTWSVVFPDASIASGSGSVAGTVFPLGTSTLTYTVRDDADQEVTCSTQVTIVDTELPTIIAPAAIVIGADTGECTASGVNLGRPTVSDNCEIDAVTNDAPSIFPIGVTRITWTVTDNAGNTATAIQTVTVQDDESPTITAPSDITLEVDEACEVASPMLGDPVIGDNCGAVTVTNDAPGVFPVGETIVTWTATDQAGNTATDTQLIKVEDKIAPTFINCPEDITIGTYTGCVTGPTWKAPIPVDNCGIASFSQISGPSPGDILAVGTYTVVYRAIDHSGNTSDCSFDITITDSTEPVIVCMDDITVQTSDPAGCIWISEPNSLSLILAEGNCPTEITYTITSPSGAITNGTGDASGSVFQAGTSILTYTVTDANGKTVSCSSEINVIESIPPSIVAPADITVDANENCEAAIESLGVPVATDNCVIVTVTNDAPAAFPIGTTTVTWTATDASNNTATATQIITVVDNTAPVIVGMPSNMTIGNDAGSCDAVATWTVPTATDNCAGVTLTSTHNSGDVFPLGTTTVTYTATDAAGNISTTSFTVTVNDTEAPSITAPDDVVVSANNACFAFGVGLGIPVTSDNCGVASVTNNAPGIYPPGVTTVTWTVTDNSGNTATATQMVTVEDTTAPTIVAPADITVDAGSNCEAIISNLGNPIAFDNCGTVTVTNDAPATFPIGTTIVTWTAVDAMNNSNTTIQRVTVTERTTTVYAGPDAVVAFGERYTLSGAMANNFASLTWTAPSGTFNNANALNPTYTPSVGALTFIDGEATVELTLTAIPVIDCGGPFVSTMILTISENPAANAGADAALCISGDITLDVYGLTGTSAANGTISWITSGTGTFANATTLTPIYTPSAADIASGSVTLTMRVTGEGGTDTDSMVLTLWRQALVSAGPDAVIAAGLSHTLSGARASNYESLFWSAPSGTFNNSNALNPTYIPDLSALTFVEGEATVALTLTAAALGNCTTAVDTMHLTITENPAANAGTDAEICITGDASIDVFMLSESSAANGTVRWTTSGTGTFDDSTVLHPQYRPSLSDIASGSVTLTLSVTGDGGTVSDGMVLTFWKQAIAFAGNDVSICNTSPYQVLDASAFNYSRVEWEHDGRGQLKGVNTLFPIYTPAADEFEVVTLTLTVIPEGSTCSPVSSKMLIDLRDTQAPKIDAPDDLTIMITQGCDIEDVLLGTPVVFDNCAIKSFSNDAPVKFPLGETKVTWTVIDAAGNTSSSVQLVKVIDNIPPNLVAPIDLVIDSGQSCFVELSDLGDPEFSDNCHVVDISNNAPKVFPIGETLVTWEATDGSGNMTQAIQKIIVKDSVAPTIIAPADITVFANNSCAVFNIELGQAEALDNCGVLSVSNDAPVVLQVGQHKITWTVIDTSGNKAIAEQLVTVIDNTAPTVVVKPITVSLEANGLVVITPDMVNNGSFDNCAIANMTLDKTLFTEANVGDNLVILTVTDIYGNTASSSTNVKIEPFGISSNPSFITGIVYESKDYFVNWGADDFGDVLPDSLEIVTGNGYVVKLPIIWNTSPIDSYSRGSYPISGALVLNQYITNPFEINGQVTVHVLAKPFLQEVTLTNNTFDSQTDFVDIPIGDFIIIDEYDQMHTLSLIRDTADNAYFKLIGNTLYWSSPEKLAGRKEFQIMLQVEDRDGNIVEKSFTVTRLRPNLSEIAVYSTFSPNGDGINDKWGVPDLRYYTGVRIQVFDRGGDKLFYTENPDIFWDGTYNGKALAIGTYYWIIEVVETGEVRKGMLNLLRK